MRHIQVRQRVKIFLPCLIMSLAMNAPGIYADEEAPQFCQLGASQIGDFAVRRAPKKILIVPLLYRNPETPRENEHWPEPSARRIEAFYRGRFHANVEWLRNVRTWKDYYAQAERLHAQGQRFDRVVFIAHGGFDGPLLKDDILFENVVVDGDKSKVLQLTEAQPGNEHVISITYKPEENKAFTDYIEHNWRELLAMPEPETRAALKQQQQQLQPIDMQCYDAFCAAPKLEGLVETQKTAKLATCEKVCRKSLYEIKYYEHVNEQRFWLFANSLNGLVKEDGLIFLGECNAGTPTPKQYSHWDTPGIVVSSKLAGGPYHNYVHLLSTATGRLVAGPIGSSSADDVVKRIFSLESNHEQRFLCMSAPLKDLSLNK